MHQEEASKIQVLQLSPGDDFFATASSNNTVQHNSRHISSEWMDGWACIRADPTVNCAVIPE